MACEGNDNKYMCCKSGSGCIANVPAVETCCSEEYTETVEVTDFEYHFDKASSSIDPQASQLQVVFKGTNAGATPQDVGKVTQSVTSSQTTGWTFSSATAMSVKTNVKTGVPFIAEGKIEIGVTETLSYGTTGSKSSSVSVSVDTGGNQVAAYSRQMFVFKSTMQIFNVPFSATATLKNQCGSTKKESITGQARVSGVASFASGDVSKLIGPAIPIECETPFNTPIQDQQNTNFCPHSGEPKCSDNALCVRFQIAPSSGDVCCDPSNPFSCCATAKAHPLCLSQKFQPFDILCPSLQGKFHPCCSGVKLKSIGNTTKSEQRMVFAVEIPDSP